MLSPNMRYVVICVASILIFGCLIWLAWELEEAREPIRTDVLGADEHGNFVVRLREQDRYDLILHCDEEKFQEAFEAFKKNLDIDDSYPPLKVPGGPMVVALADELLPDNLIPDEVVNDNVQVDTVAPPDDSVFDETILYGDDDTPTQNNVELIQENVHTDVQGLRCSVRQRVPNPKYKDYVS